MWQQFGHFGCQITPFGADLTWTRLLLPAFQLLCMAVRQTKLVLQCCIIGIAGCRLIRHDWFVEKRGIYSHWLRGVRHCRNNRLFLGHSSKEVTSTQYTCSCVDGTAPTSSVKVLQRHFSCAKATRKPKRLTSTPPSNITPSTVQKVGAPTQKTSTTPFMEGEASSSA